MNMKIVFLVMIMNIFTRKFLQENYYYEIISDSETSENQITIFIRLNVNHRMWKSLKNQFMNCLIIYYNIIQ